MHPIELEDNHEMTPEEKAHFYLSQAIDCLKINKPNDRSDKDRHYAIVITEIEKVQAIADRFLKD
jgi:hypothetical protein